MSIIFAVGDWYVVNMAMIYKNPSFHPQLNPYSLWNFGVLENAIWLLAAWMYKKGGGSTSNAIRMFATGFLINASGVNNFFYYWFGGMSLQLPEEWAWLVLQSWFFGHIITTPELAISCIIALLFSILIWCHPTTRRGGNET